MLHRTNKEIDKKGNVIGGELKEKCDKFISCLDKFQDEYLSDKFNINSESGASQEKVARDFERWVKKLTVQYNKEKQDREKRKKANDDYIKYLKDLVPKLKAYLELANQQNLDDDTIRKFKDVLSAEGRRHYERVVKQNQEIARNNEAGQQEYAREQAAYERDREDYDRKMVIWSTARRRYDDEMTQYRYYLSEYNSQKAWINAQNAREEDRHRREMAEYNTKLMQWLNNRERSWADYPQAPLPGKRIELPPEPQPPTEPNEPQAPTPPAVFIPKSFIPLPDGSLRVPDSIDDTLLKIIEGIVSKNSGSTSKKTNDENNKTFCTEFIAPLLDKAYRYANTGIKNPVVCESEDSPQEWFLKRATDNITRMYLQWDLLCEYDKDGLPQKTKRIPDIYWTAWRLNLSDAFSECVKDFKPDKKGSSATKKWIEKVCKELKKFVDDCFVERYIKKKLEVLAKALSIKPPSTISKRPTIKQKPVKTKISNLTEHIKKAIQKV